MSLSPVLISLLRSGYWKVAERGSIRQCLCPCALSSTAWEMVGAVVAVVAFVAFVAVGAKRIEVDGSNLFQATQDQRYFGGGGGGGGSDVESKGDGSGSGASQTERWQK